MKPAVFYFSFFDVDGENIGWYGFNMDIVSNSLLKSLNEDNEPVGTICEVLEDYGVHDWSSRPNDAVFGIGYTTYEVEPDKIMELMNKWRNAFASISGIANVTKVVQLPDPNIEQFDDLDIYNLVHKMTGA